MQDDKKKQVVHHEIEIGKNLKDIILSILVTALIMFIILH